MTRSRPWSALRTGAWPAGSMALRVLATSAVALPAIAVDTDLSAASASSQAAGGAWLAGLVLIAAAATIAWLLRRQQRLGDDLRATRLQAQAL